MKKHILYLILLLTCSLQSVAQSGVQYQGTVYSKVMTRGIYGADSGIIITPSDTFNKLVPVGTIRFLTDFSEFVFTGAYWKLISAPSLSNYMRYADSAAMLSPYARKTLLADTALAIQGRIDAKQATLVSGTNIKTINGTSLLGSGNISISGGGGETDTASLSTRIDARVKYTDTASMLIGYVKAARLNDTASAIRATIPSVTGKVNYTDTATMLGNYARKTLVADTAAAIRSAIPSVTGKLNISDTAAMLATYAKIQRLLDTALAIQSRLNLKLNIANPTATGTLTAPAVTISALSSGTTNDSVLVADPSTGAVRRISSSRISSGGSGGTPGGSTTQFQFNNAGAFGGTSGLTWDAVNNRMKFGGGTKTAELSIISSAAFGDGNIYIESSDGSGAAITLNSTSGSGKKYSLFSRPTNTFGIYDYGVGAYVAEFNAPDYQSLRIRGTSVDGAGLALNPTASGGTTWTINSPATGSGLGAGRLVFFNGATRMTLLDNGTLGIGTTAPSANAMLDVQSTSKGILPPRLTTSERDAISWTAADEGMLIFNKTTKKGQQWNGTTWNDLY